MSADLDVSTATSVSASSHTLSMERDGKEPSMAQYEDLVNTGDRYRSGYRITVSTFLCSLFWVFWFGGFCFQNKKL